MALRSRVVGDKELLDNMKKVSQAVAGRSLDKLCATSLEPMRADTQKNALRLRQVGYNPPGGHLDEGVVVAKREERGRGYRVFWLAFRNRARKIAHLVEFGTLPHYQPRRRVHHPGARPKPFIRPAYEGQKQTALKLFAEGSWALIRDFTLKATATRRRR